RQPSLSFLDVLLGVLEFVRLFLRLLDEFIDAGRAAELIALAIDHPGELRIGLRQRDRANPVTRLRLEIMRSQGAPELFGGSPLAVGLDVTGSVFAPGRQVEPAFLLVIVLRRPWFLVAAVLLLGTVADRHPEAFASDPQTRQGHLELLSIEFMRKAADKLRRL